MSDLVKRLVAYPPRVWESLYPFVETYGTIYADLWRGKRNSFIVVLLFMMFTAWVRMFMIVLLAGSAHVLGNNGTIDLLGFEFSLGSKLEAVILMAAFMALITFAATFTSYETERRIWALGRWMNELAVSRTDAIIRRGPRLQVLMKFARPANINVLMSQVPMHVGLVSVTLVRMLNPVTLMVFAGTVIVFKQPLIALAVLIVASCIVPFYIAQSLSVLDNSKKFYSDVAHAYALGLSKRIMFLNSQSGVAIPENIETDVIKQDYYTRYMEAFNRNVLANEMMMMVVSFISVLIVPLLFLVLGLLYSYGHLSLPSLITTIGAVLYLITSARSVASNITNLIRSFSQVRTHIRLLKAADEAVERERQALPSSGGKWPAHLSLDVKAAGSRAATDAIVVHPGQTVMLSIDDALSNFSLNAVLGPLVDNGVLSAESCDQLSFVGAAYRFGEGTIREHLAARNAALTTEQIEAACRNLNALDSFEALPQGLETQMSEEVWKSLGRNGQFSLRVAPLMLAPPRMVLLDSAVVQGGGKEAFARLLAGLPDTFVFVTVTAGSTIPDVEGLAYGVISSGRLVGWGDREWFRGAHPAKRAKGSILGTDEMVLQAMLSVE